MDRDGGKAGKGSSSRSCEDGWDREHLSRMPWQLMDVES